MVLVGIAAGLIVAVEWAFATLLLTATGYGLSSLLATNANVRKAHRQIAVRLAVLSFCLLYFLIVLVLLASPKKLLLVTFPEAAYVAFGVLGIWIGSLEVRQVLKTAKKPRKTP